MKLLKFLELSKPMKSVKPLTLFCIALIFALIPTITARAAESVLIITGNGVEQEITLTEAELRAMTGHITQSAYSAWNTWPTRRTYYARGVSLAHLLDLAGLLPSATTINIAEADPIAGSDGYNMTFLLEDLLGERFTFDEGRNRVAVPTIIAFYVSQRSFAEMTERGVDLRLIHGQLAEQEQTTMGFVRHVRTITVTDDPIRQLPQPEAAIERLPGGQYSITLSSSNPSAKVHYTTDGTIPTAESNMFNISAPQWQPELNVPFTVTADTQIRAIAIASGFASSEVLSFTPRGFAGTNGIAGASGADEASGANGVNGANGVSGVSGVTRATGNLPDNLVEVGAAASAVVTNAVLLILYGS